jgi:RecB family exonuclease
MGLFTGDQITTIADEEVSQKELGTRVHACLETADYEGLQKLEQEVGADRFCAEPVMSWALNSPWMRPEIAGEREVWTELAFEIPIAGEVLVGSIDRVVYQRSENDFRYTVIDFKVTQKLKTEEELKAAYLGQLQLYAWALTRLAPEAAGKVDCVLINISAHEVREVVVSLSAQAPFVAEDWATLASEMLNGKEGIPQPGSLCRVCEFKSQCQ